MKAGDDGEILGIFHDALVVITAVRINRGNNSIDNNNNNNLQNVYVCVCENDF